MADKSYQYTLTKEDYIQYLRYVSANTPSSRRLRNYLIASVPVLLTFTCFYFRNVLTWGHILVAVAFTIYWILRAAPFIWKNLFQKRISDNMIAKVKVETFPPVKLTCSDKGLIVNKQQVSYQSINKIIVLKDILVVFHSQKEAIIVPFRIFENTQAQQEFIAELDSHLPEPDTKVDKTKKN